LDFYVYFIGCNFLLVVLKMGVEFALNLFTFLTLQMIYLESIKYN